MNTMFKTLSLAVVGSLMAIGTAHADVVGASSNIYNIAIGTAQSNPDHDGNSDYPGVRVTAADAPFGNFTIAFDTLQTLSGIDATIDGFKISTLNVTDMPPSHSQLGNFDFVQVPNSDVYFGEWHSDRGNRFNGHTVYYGGKNKTTVMPSNGIVTYKVKGISHLQENGLLTGNMTANFNTNKLTGAIGNENYIMMLGNNVDINPNDASFSGSAEAAPLSIIRELTSGQVEGNFFGSQASQLAGIAEFGPSWVDVAFGGTRIDNRAKDISDVAARQ